jgi:O-succinylbenzoic acid--CoA ligase
VGPQDESQLVAVLATGAAAAAGIADAWAAGRAVAVLDPEHPDLAVRLGALAPTHVLDDAGEQVYPGGRPVPGPVGAVVATSGTTDTPRFVMLDRAALTASARSVTAALGLDADRDRWLACLPLHHIAGLAIVVRGLVTGVPVAVHRRFDADEVARTAGAATVVSLVPTTLARLLDAHPAAVGRFRRILLGGGPVDPDLVRAAEATGTAVATTYGLTETGGGCVHDGRPLDGVELALAPDTHEIQVRGPVLMRGYRATADGVPLDDPIGDDGWLATGDVGRWSADGRLEVVDRRKDLVVTGGVNVSPIAVEARLCRAPGVADLAVVGLPDPEWGEQVVACVVAAADGPPSLEALRAFGRDHGLATAELPRSVRSIRAVPRSSGGKILRRALRDALAATPADQPDGGE